MAEAHFRVYHCLRSFLNIFRTSQLSPFDENLTSPALEAITLASIASAFVPQHVL